MKKKSTPSLAVVLVAAGEGKRLGKRGRKGLIRLGGKPLFLHSLETFAGMREVKEIVLVVHRLDRLLILKKWGKSPQFRKVSVVEGGETRFDSVRNGLAQIGHTAPWIAVHDAARPFLTPRLVRSVLRGAQREAGGVPAVPLADTLKKEGERGRILKTVPRERLWGAQTPQIFRGELLQEVYRSSRKGKNVTDDASLFEKAGVPVRLIPGDPMNFKITRPADLAFAEEWVRFQRKSGRRGGK